MNDKSQFSEREKEVTELLLQGKSNKQIALALGISTSTVEYHLKNIYKKLQVSSRTEAVLLLGKSTGSNITSALGKSTVEMNAETIDNGVQPISTRRIPMNKMFAMIGVSLLAIALVVVIVLANKPVQNAEVAPTVQVILTSTPTFMPTLEQTDFSTSTPANSTLMGTCPVETADLKLFINVNDGFCFLYPIEDAPLPPYMVVINPNGISGGDFLPGDALVLVNVEAASGRTAAQVADGKIAEAGDGFNIMRSEILIDGKQAIVVDGLPAQDPWREVFIVGNDRLYILFFEPWTPNAEWFSKLEKLYSTVIKTLHFLPVAP